MEVIPTQASHWPVDYHSAVIQARDNAGRLHFGSLAVPPACLVEFCHALLTRLDAVPEFELAYFGHELRGLKGGTAHSDKGRHPEKAFNTFFENVDETRIDEANWFIDVGLEIYNSKRVVQWLKHAHPAILKYIMPSLEDDEIQALIRRKTFHLNNVSQLEDFAGVHCDPTTFGRRDGVTVGDKQSHQIGYLSNLIFLGKTKVGFELGGAEIVQKRGLKLFPCFFGSAKF